MGDTGRRSRVLSLRPRGALCGAMWVVCGGRGHCSGAPRVRSAPALHSALGQFTEGVRGGGSAVEPSPHAQEESGPLILRPRVACSEGPLTHARATALLPPARGV